MPSRERDSGCQHTDGTLNRLFSALHKEKLAVLGHLADRERRRHSTITMNPVVPGASVPCISVWRSVAWAQK